MKRILITIAVMLILTGGLVSANGRHLNGNFNWKLIHIHMGYASYMDYSSAILKLYDNQNGAIIAANIIMNVHPKYIEAQKSETVWVYIPSPSKISGYTSVRIDGRNISLPPNLGDKVSYISNDSGKNWRPVRIDDTHGYNLFDKRIIDRAFEAISFKYR